MKKLYKGIFAGIILATLSSSSFAESENDPLVGKWKTIDDRTGYSRADAEISKQTDGTYEGDSQRSGIRKNGDLFELPGQLKKQTLSRFTFYLGF